MRFFCCNGPNHVNTSGMEGCGYQACNCRIASPLGIPWPKHTSHRRPTRMHTFFHPTDGNHGMPFVQLGMESRAEVSCLTLTVTQSVRIR